MGRGIDTLASGTRLTHEIEIKRSRFITTLARTDSSEEARALIAAVRSAHPQARHHCSAYLIDADGLNPQQHSSDDGEPSGTAGTPMLEALRAEGVWNATAVVTRYFGGVLLGGGGLVRAYSSSVAQALALAPRARLERRLVLEASFAAGEAGRIEAEVRTAGAHVLAVDWGTRTLVRLAVDEADAAAIGEIALRATGGVTRFHEAGTTVVEVAGPGPRP
ncbi:IMPACT family protein [Actinomyces sp. B33]|uniref:IMPACT family protein n=1 Tax=Actinomyces sp. B33 TaxID=2942131 RepID=UPI002340DACA|nr:YigZ family protein [Actinomyces sp. B33]MDC4232894.1 IMPACT family protein [Actinomyces sp. B33]